MPALSRLLPALAGASLLAALAGCAVAPAPLPSGDPVPPRPGPATPSDPAAPSAIALDCAGLLDADTVFAFNPNFALLDDWTPEPGTAGAEALAAGGLACRWVAESGGATIDAAATRLGDDGLDAAEAEAAAAGEAAEGPGDAAYFSSDASGRGALVAFQGSDRLVLASQYFVEPGDASALAEAALAALAAAR